MSKVWNSLLQTNICNVDPNANKPSIEYASNRFTNWKTKNLIASMTQPGFDRYLAKPNP